MQLLERLREEIIKIRENKFINYLMKDVKIYVKRLLKHKIYNMKVI